MANFKTLTNSPDQTTYFVGEDIVVTSSVEYTLGVFDTAAASSVASQLSLEGDPSILRSQAYLLSERSTGFDTFSSIFGTGLTFNTSGLSGGVYNVTTRADVNEAVTESDEKDNTLTTAINIYDAVDLVLWNLDAEPAGIAQGDSFDFNIGLRNALQDFGQDLSDYTVRFVASTNDLFSTFDTTLATYTLGDFTIGDDGIGGEEYELAATITVPDELAAQDYFIGLVFDHNNDFHEQTENRVMQLWSGVSIQERDVDLAVSDLNIDDTSMEDGETVTGSITVSNNGTAGTQDSVFVRVEMIKVLGGSFIPVELDRFEQTVSLEPGGSTQIDISALISQGATDFAPGEYNFQVSVSEDNIFDFAAPFQSLTFNILPESGNQPAPEPGTGSDFDSNGADDILFFNETTRKVGQFEMPDGSWNGIGGAGVGWEAVGIGKFDDDDTSSDILWFNESTGGVGRFDMDGGTLDRWDGIGSAGAGWAAVGTGDFNGDGVDDILWVNENSGNVGQFRMIDTDPNWIGVGRTGTGWEVAGIADFNSDGIDDILWEKDDGALGRFQMASDGSKEWVSMGKMGSGWSVADTGRFYVPDAAEADDILVFNEATNAIGVYDIYNSGNSNDWISLGTAGAGWSIQGTGDFDADGDDDILWRHEDGRIGQYQMSDEMTSGGSYMATTWDSIGVAGTDWDVMI